MSREYNIPVDPARNNEGYAYVTMVRVMLSYHKPVEQPGHDCFIKELSGYGRGDRGWAATKLHLNMTTARCRLGISCRGDRGWVATSEPGKLPVERAARSR